MKGKNLFGFIIYSLMYWGVQLLVFLNLQLSSLADINAGIIAGIWNLVPLFMAILDYIFYRQLLNRYHIMGVCSLVVCALLITIAGQVDGEDPVVTPYAY